jgi:type IV secretion system protein TrbE
MILDKYLKSILTWKRPYQSRDKSLPDILNYNLAYDEGIYLNKDGSFSTGFIYTAPDVTSCTINERNLDAMKINDALKKLCTDGWMVHVELFREEVFGYIDPFASHFADPISKLIDTERREFFKDGDKYVSTIAIFLTYMNPSAKTSKFVEMMVDENKEGKESIETILVRKFRTKTDEVFSALSTVVNIRKMKVEKIIDEYGQTHYQDEFLKYINFCIVGRKQNINVPPVGMYLDSYIGCYRVITGLNPKIDNTYLGIVGIEGFPQESYPNILNTLATLNINYRWSTRFIFMSKEVASGHIDMFRRKFQQKTKGLISVLFGKADAKVNQFAVDMVYDTDEAQRALDSTETGYGYYTSSIVLYDTDMSNLENSCKEVKRIIENLGFTTRIEGINTFDAWLGSLPSNSIANVRRPLIKTENLSHFMPLSSIWAGDEFNSSDKYPPQSPPLAVALTAGSTPFRLNLHVGDLGHTLIFGPTGSGKSTLLAFLVSSQRRYHNARIISFDKGRSLYPVTLAFGGLHFDVGNENSKLSFAPLANLENEVDKAWASEWIETLVVLQGMEVSVEDRQHIKEALNLHISTKSKSLTEFVSNIQSTKLRATLEHYTLAGSMGFLLDAETDGLQMSNLMTFELEDLMNLGEKNLVPVLLYLFKRIQDMLDGRPTMLVLDEAWIALGHPTFRNKIKEWLKVLRKSNCHVVMATQSLSDASNSGILDVLSESCPTKIFLPNPDAFNKGSEKALAPYDLYRLFGLNDAMIGIIATSQKKKHYYLFSESGTRLFDLALGKIALAFMASSDKNSLSVIQKLAEKNPENWAFDWLEYKGIEYENLVK